MTNRLAMLESHVKDLYQQKARGRADWADWLWEHHVLVVADFADTLADRFGANKELCRAAALLHDIADVKMKRREEAHETESLKIAGDILYDCAFTDDEINLLVDDAIKYHSCHGSEHPESIEGHVLSTADALAHIKTDFYLFFFTALHKDVGFEQMKQKCLDKLERDMFNKIYFDEVRKEVRPDYDQLKDLFSR